MTDILELDPVRRCPGAAGTVGCLRDRAAMAVFSSTDNTKALVGCDRYRPHTSAARSQNNGSFLRVNQPRTW